MGNSLNGPFWSGKSDFSLYRSRSLTCRKDTAVESVAQLVEQRTFELECPGREAGGRTAPYAGTP